MQQDEKLQDWMQHTPLGRDILSAERILYSNYVHNIFGYHALQIGFDSINFLQGNKISNHYVTKRNLQCDLRFLPLAENSIDLIICPHVLEFLPNYHHFLQECYRVLIPNGKLIITVFNPNSLLGIMKNKIEPLQIANFIKLAKLKQQLETLNFSIDGGKFTCYKPPVNKQKTLEMLSFLDKIGDRWFPTLSDSYALFLSKEIITPTRINPFKQVNLTEKLATKLGHAREICSKI